MPKLSFLIFKPYNLSAGSTWFISHVPFPFIYQRPYIENNIFNVHLYLDNANTIKHLPINEPYSISITLL